jgi:uncharacterized hydrophobic protein (TIGR00271 family)
MLRDLVIRAQDRALDSLGGTPHDRPRAVTRALERSRRDAVSYYLQLGIATGIGVLGLVLGSTAVVIGAMLVSPLMGPIVDLGMGLAVGSPVLLLRALVRNAVSIALVIAGSATIVRALPFQTTTAEIIARTTPTALDLLIAMFCALAALYTTVRQSSDTQSAAAGTAIGISLVPPLCVVGYGIGTTSWDIALGSTLLFVANFSAIMLVSTLGLVILGFGQVPIADIDAAELAVSRGGQPTRLERGLEQLFQSRFSPLLRLVTPALLLAAVYVPLRRALVEVGWEVRVRNAVSSLVSGLDVEAVSSTVAVQRHSVAVRLVIVGTTEQAHEVSGDLTQRIRSVSGVTPGIEVVAVPDPDAMRAVVDSLRATAQPVAVATVPPARSFASALEAALKTSWPGSAGARLAVSATPTGGSLLVAIVHRGPPLGAAGRELLGEALRSALGVAVTVSEDIVPAEVVVADAPTLLATVAAMAAATERLEDYRLCVETVPSIKPGSAAARAAEIAAAFAALQTRYDQIAMRAGERFAVTAAPGPCPATEPPTARPRDVPGPSTVVPSTSTRRAGPDHGTIVH